jgi:3-oxosteroid 1-dehydrogenase
MANQVIVVGSGAAGFSAAIAAATNGARVTLLERAVLLGGTTSYSGGVVWFPANPWAAAEGIKDSREDALTYLTNLGLGAGDRGQTEVFVSECIRVAHGLEAASPIRWQTMDWPDYQAHLPGGKLIGRTLELAAVEVGPEIDARVRPDPRGAPPVTYLELRNGPPDATEIDRRQRHGIPARGRGLVAALLAGALQHGVEIRTGARATKLVLEGGAVRGVECDGQVLSGHVVLASGGFDRDPELVRHFLRMPAVLPGGPPGMEGDALRMGMSVGAALGNMSEAWWSPAMELPGRQVDGQPYNWLMFGESGRPGGLLLDRLGRRYVNESTNYNDLGRAMHAFDAATYTFPRVPSWFVCDAARRAAFPIGPVGPRDPDPEWMISAPSLEALAARLDMKPAVLGATVERYNGHAARGFDEDFGRGSYARDAYTSGLPNARDQLRPLTEAPFYAVRVMPGTLGTKGGVQLDPQARVRAATGGVIDGLYAAGNASANPFGFGYPGGGGTIGPALVFGWLAGETASAA